MSAGPGDPHARLVHDVNSKCSSLRTAAAMLKEASPSEAEELTTLMLEQTRKIADCIAAYRRARGGC